MMIDTDRLPTKSMITSLAAFLRDYMAYAGAKGIVGAGLVLLGAMFEGIGLALIAPLLAVLFKSGAGGGTLLQMSNALFDWCGATTITSRLAVLMSIFAVAMIIRAAVLLARDVRLFNLRIGFVEMQREKVACALAKAPWHQVAHLRHAQIVQVMSSDIQQIGVATQFLTQCVTAVAMLTAQCVLAFYLSLPLALLALGLLATSAVALFPMMRHAKKLGDFTTSASQHLLHTTAQFLGGLKLAVSQNLQERFLDEFRSVSTSRSAGQLKYLRQQTQFRLAIATVSALTGAALVLLGLTVFHMSPSALVALLLVVTRMSGPSGQVQQGGQMLANALPAHEAVQKLVRELEGLEPPPNVGNAALPPKGEIQFDHVSFAHSLDSSGLRLGVHDITVSIPPGSCLGIKGPSGAGKTTFADLLAGLYLPQSGVITIGGEPLTGALLTCWREAISYVVQDPFLFHDTLRRNLTWACSSVSEQEIWQALELAEAADIVRTMSHGLDTVVGERGMLVSGGERQRLALARAVLRRPTLLILDEATNAVDLATEQTILSHLKTLSPRPTLVIIAHRPESLSGCQRVLTLEGGLLQ